MLAWLSVKLWAACVIVCLYACDNTQSLEAAPADSDAGAMQVSCARPARPAPSSIADMISLLNALPKPVTLPCVLEALPHPLAIHAVDSVLSAQPAVGERSPRIFVFLDGLIVSVVPAGTGSRLLELGERRSDMDSLKAELEFPIERELSASAPYMRLRFDDNTSTSTCGFCHTQENPADDVDDPYARISRSIRPMPSQRVSLAALQTELANCAAAQEPERCAMLRAVFGPSGKAVDAEFPTQWKTFF